LTENIFVHNITLNVLYFIQISYFLSKSLMTDFCLDVVEIMQQLRVICVGLFYLFIYLF